MSTESKTYNGWTNYETWCVKLWIDNEEGLHLYWCAVAQEVWDESDPFRHFSREERAVVALSDRLKDEHEEDRPDLGASVWNDMLRAAFDEVNWREIAASMIDEVDKTEPESDEEE